MPLGQLIAQFERMRSTITLTIGFSETYKYAPKIDFKNEFPYEQSTDKYNGASADLMRPYAYIKNNPAIKYAFSEKYEAEDDAFQYFVDLLISMFI